MPSITSTANYLPKLLPDVALVLCVAFFLGVVSGGRVSPASVLIAVMILPGLFGAYSLLLARRPNMRRGLAIGVFLGALLGGVGILVGGVITDVRSGLWLGAVLGFFLGALVGLVSRVEYADQDKLPAKLFLFVGSILLGASLGAGVGLMTGFILGSILQSWAGLLLAMLASAVVGGYLGSYFHRPLWIVVGVFSAVGITAVSLWLGGAFAGLVLGSIAGSLAPMLLVAAIGAAGGLLARGPRAMVAEAFEAPAEMIEQGAVPYLLPAVITGAVVGSSAAGPDGLSVLAVSLGLLGMLFGAMADVDGRPRTVITVRSLVEMTMIGSDEWPIMRLLGMLVGEQWRRALLGAIGGTVLGLLGALSGLIAAAWLVSVAGSWWLAVK
jgi:hypothetical protein